MSSLCQSSPAARLLFVTGTAVNVRQGSGTYVGIATLRRALRELGHAVELIAPPPAATAAWRRLWFNYLLQRRPDYVTGAWDAVVGFDLDGIFLTTPGVWNVASIKGVLADERRFERGAARLSLALQARLERRRVRRANRVLATSRYAAAAIVRHYGVELANIRIVPELIDLRAWRARLQAVERRPRTVGSLLCVAHLYPRKDVATLLRALARMRASAILRVVGAGAELGRLRRLARRLGIAARVCFPGHLPLAALTQEYRDADIFCLPSRQEGFGIVLLEAMAAGLPVVAARAAAIPEVVPEGECGWLFEPGNAGELAARLDQLLADPAQRRRLGAAGRSQVERYDAPRVAREFLRAIDLSQDGT